MVLVPALLSMLYLGFLLVAIFVPPPQWGGLDLGSDNSGCARLGGSKVTFFLSLRDLGWVSGTAIPNEATTRMCYVHMYISTYTAKCRLPYPARSARTQQARSRSGGDGGDSATRVGQLRVESSELRAAAM